MQGHNESVSPELTMAQIAQVLGRPNEDPRTLAALSIIVHFGQTDGAHHKAWVIDQVTRLLTGDLYDTFVTWANDGEDGPTTYSWDVGISP